jgi:hypothetical protein
MSEKNGSVAVLNETKSQELLHAPLMAHIAYDASDGTPRVTPVWFAWEDGELIICSIVSSTKFKVLKDGARVAIDIDEAVWPYHRLGMRGSVAIKQFPGIPPGYRETAVRYLGDQFGNAFMDQLENFGVPMNRIAIKPDWVGLYNFEDRPPTG